MGGEQQLDTKQVFLILLTSDVVKGYYTFLVTETSFTMLSKKMPDLAPQEGQLAKDIQLYKQRLKKKPRSHVFLPLAKAYCKAGKYKEAVETCQQGLLRQPNYWAAQVILGQAYLEQGMLDEALAQLEAVVREVPNNLLASRLIGQIYVKQERIKEAIERYTNILNYYPECDDLKEALYKLTTEKKRQYKMTILVLEDWLKEIRTRASPV